MKKLSINAKLLISGVTRKSYRGGVCLYINQKWCKNFIVREQVCLPDNEVLSMSMRPYLPREFPQTSVTVVSIIKRTQRLRLTPSPTLCTHSDLSLLRPLILFWGTLITVIWRRHWAVSINMWTHFNKSLDLCYGFIKGAQTSVAGPALGSSDHNTVHLPPVCAEERDGEETPHKGLE